MQKIGRGGSVRSASLVAAVAVAAGLALSGPLAPQTHRSEAVVSGLPSNPAGNCLLSAARLGDLDGLGKCAGTVKPVFERQQTFDWI
ncbi:hypothetical protein ACGFS9_25525 [Streptomyces sp. NPDC048566]|uniref:hypothetical protein n=1 Tax=Streptomyces sp. NPDC048566 TaxID=3365569 RepID=UPI00371202E9